MPCIRLCTTAQFEPLCIEALPAAPPGNVCKVIVHGYPVPLMSRTLHMDMEGV